MGSHVRIVATLVVAPNGCFHGTALPLPAVATQLPGRWAWIRS